MFKSTATETSPQLSAGPPLKVTTGPAGAMLDQLLAEWVADQVITTDQADRIRQREGLAPALAPGGQPQRRGRHSSIAAEVFGYLGGAIVVAAAMLFAALYWDRLGDAVQLAILAVVAGLLVAAGLLVPRSEHGAAGRLITVLWLAGTVASTGAFTMWANLMHLHGGRWMLVSGGTAAVAVALWWAHRSFVQQAMVQIAVTGFVAAVAVQVSSDTLAPMVAAWLVGIAWVVLALTGRLRPAVLATAFSAGIAILAILIATETTVGIVLALVTMAAAIAVAVLRQDLLLLGVAAVGTLVTVLNAVSYWFEESPAAAVALLLVGLGLVGVAIRIVRHGGLRRRPQPPPAA